MTDSPGSTSARFAALGGLAVVAVTKPGALATAVDSVRRVVGDFDRACSSYRADSELSAVNRAGGAPVVVSGLFIDALQEAVRAARITDGDVDPTIGDALIAYGFFNDDEPAPERPRVSLQTVRGYEALTIDRQASTVALASGVTLDLGATAKALAADRAAAAASAAAQCGALVSLSGDLAIVGEPPPDGWVVRVTDDHRSGFEAPGQTIVLRSGGLATSSTTVRRRATSDARDGVHHVIDPRTGRPAEVHFRTVSVAAASCLDANIASTAAIVRGERAVAWLEGAALPGRLVRVDGTVLHVAGWPSAGEDLPLESPAVESRAVWG